MPPTKPPLTAGESVSISTDYDLFGINASGAVGIYIKIDERTGKCLVFMSQHNEWAEVLEEHIHRPSPGEVSPFNQEFTSRIKTLETTR